MSSSSARLALHLLLLLLQVLLLFPLSLTAQQTPSSSSSCRCLPSSPCWPDPASWSAFNSSLDGLLFIPSPPASSCYHPNALNSTACQIVRLHWKDPFWRSDQAGAMQTPYWEADGNRSCSITNSADPNNLCYQGAVPAYAVQVLDASHVQTAVQYAAKHDLRLTIKTTGHDFLGRSTAPGSLNLWMHGLKGITFHDQFVPDGCSASEAETEAGAPAVTAGVGVQWRELYEAAEAQNVVVVGGMSNSVSTGGGYVQGGGHSPLGPLLGMAADSVLQFTVVTADGKLRIANSCQNQDLFWALRGGGGGSFGVVVSATHKTFPALSSVVSASFVASANTSNAFQLLVTKFIELQPSLSDVGWAGYSYIGSTMTIYMTYLLPNSNLSIAQPSFYPLTELADSHPDIHVNGTMELYSSFLDWHNTTLCATNRGVCSDLTGSNTVYASRLLSKDTLRDFEQEVADAFMQIVESNILIVGHLVGGGAVADTEVEGKNNSVNPAWRKAVWHVVLVASWSDNADAKEKEAKLKGLTDMNGLLRNVSAGSGAYMNEADPNEPNWQQSFFGDNYERLRSIKYQQDPGGLFMCKKCVGSEDWTEDLTCRLDQS